MNNAPVPRGKIPHRHILSVNLTVRSSFQIVLADVSQVELNLRIIHFPGLSSSRPRDFPCTESMRDVTVSSELITAQCLPLVWKTPGKRQENPTKAYTVRIITAYFRRNANLRIIERNRDVSHIRGKPEQLSFQESTFHVEAVGATFNENERDGATTAESHITRVPRTRLCNDTAHLLPRLEQWTESRAILLSIIYRNNTVFLRIFLN